MKEKKEKTTRGGKQNRTPIVEQKILLRAKAEKNSLLVD
jgi:hypothetical protein